MIKLRNLPIKEREFCQEDFNFIVNSWLVSYRQSEEFKKVSNKNYYEAQSKIILAIIQNPDTKIKILCNEKDEEQIFCYLVYNDKKNLIHFVYTKYNFRRFGLAKKLIESVFEKEKWDEVEATFYKTFSPFKYNPLERK